MKVLLDKEKWMKYCRAVGDDNPIHFDDDRARAVEIKTRNALKKLKSAPAPGMYLAALVCSRFSHFGKNGIYRFNDFSYDKDYLSFEEKQGRIFVLNQNGNTVCRVSTKLEADNFDASYPIYSGRIIREKMELLEESVGAKISPELYVSCVSVSGLLSRMSKNPAYRDRIGIHVSHSYKTVGDICLDGIIDIRMSLLSSVEESLVNIGLKWFSNDKLVGIGESKIILA